MTAILIRRCVMWWCAMVVLPHLAFAEPPTPGTSTSKVEQPSTNQGLLDLLREVEDLKREVKSLRGEVENQGYAIEQLKKSQTATSTGEVIAPLPTLKTAPAEGVAGAPAAEGDLHIETNGTGEANANSTSKMQTDSAASSPPAGTMAVAPSTEAVAPTNDSATAKAPALSAAGDDAGSEAAYRDAFALLKSGEYPQAIAAFSAFQTQYPHSQYGDNAQFWLAETYYVKRDFNAALPEYQKLVDTYPESKKLSHALLKIGYCHAELGRVDEARKALESVKQRFPDSAAAQIATQRLGQLKPTSH